MKLASIDTGLLPEFTVRGLLEVMGPPFTVADLKTYCVPPTAWGVMNCTVQFVLALQVRFAGVV
jgi:hypothetical protein